MRSRSSGPTTSGRSGPSTIFSRASRKSFWATSSCSRRAARSAASLTRFLRSAPESPGVEDASSPRSTLRASGTLLVWTLRMASRATYGVELIDEDDRRGVLARLLEEVPDAAGANPHEQLNELGGAQGEERNPSLPRHCPRQERLARSRRPHKEHALRCRTAEAGVLLGVLEEVHD